MVDPTAFARVAAPQQQGIGGGLASIIAGEQAGRVQRAEQLQTQARDIGKAAFNAWNANDMQGYQAQLRQLSTLDPKAADDLNGMFGGIRKQNLGEAAMIIYAASASSDMDAKKQLLRQSKDVLQADPNNVFNVGIDRMLAMDDPEKLNEELFGSVQMAANMGLLPGAAAGMGPGAPEFQKTQGYLVRENGKTFYVNPVFNKQTGTYNMEKTEMTGELLNQLGMTAEEAKTAALTESAQKRAQEGAAKQQEQFQKQYYELRGAIDLTDQAMNVIQNGIEKGEFLGVGPIARYVPKLNETSQRLQNIGRQMGLKVIQSTTFGALSAPEMKLALETGFPEGLSGQSLLNYLRDRKSAQEKLLNELYDASTFINTIKPDGTVNTAADWMRMKDQQRREAQPQGGAQPEAAEQQAPQLQQFSAQQAAELPTFRSVEEGEASGAERFKAPGPGGKMYVY